MLKKIKRGNKSHDVGGVKVACISDNYVEASFAAAFSLLWV